MLLRVGCPSPSLLRTSPFSLFARTPSLFLFCRSQSCSHSVPLHRRRYFNPIDANAGRATRLSEDRSSRLCTVSASLHKPSSATPQRSTKAMRKAHRESAAGLLQRSLDMCSKLGDVVEALRLYDDARSNGVPLGIRHYNVLLYLCSSSDTEEGLARGFEIFKQMSTDKVPPNEATFTSAARLAAAKEDPETAFDLVKQMKSCGIPPKLRSYGPALFGFCNKKMPNRAYEVDAHMVESGIAPEEQELSALMKVSSEAKREDRVYQFLQRLRTTVRQVSEETVCVVEDWFLSETAAEVGKENWDVGKVKGGVLKGGGGWHGHGWLGSGKWTVRRTNMSKEGVCCSCGEKLVCIDIDPRETEIFASSLTTLACQREVKSDFMQFQEWLQRNGPFDAIVDGANIGLMNQLFFNFHQLNSVVNKLRGMSGSKRLPLVVLHRSRVINGPALNPNNKKLLEEWKKAGALYATPPGSNDDWYWLYAAVSSKCLLVTNDEMRDHLFQLLGTSFFPRWKEKHQVRITASRHGPNLHMPPPYSIVIQESEKGSWHVPTVSGDNLDTPRQWLCANRNP